MKCWCTVWERQVSVRVRLGLRTARWGWYMSVCGMLDGAGLGLGLGLGGVG